MRPGVVTLTMPAKSEYLILARLALAGIARQVPMSETLLADLKLAVTEACGNAVRHATPVAGGFVRVCYRVDADRIEIEVQDEGTEGIHSNGAEPESGALVESGMGLAIIRAIVDELEIEGVVDGSGTVVRMRKQLTRD